MIFGIDHHWFEAFHVISVTAWMVGLFYLPRLFAYHSSLQVSSVTDKLFNTMQKKLLFYIMTPAMIFAVLLGLLLAFGTGHIYSGWLHLKLVFVLSLVLLHFFFWSCHNSFKSGANSRSATFYKIVNELVTVFFVAIVLLAYLKPF